MLAKKLKHQSKSIKDKETIKIPDILFVANKIEENYIPFSLYESEIIQGLNYPLFISAQQGDGLPELHKEIR